MKRLIIVYNPRSSHFGDVKEQVIEPARHLRGWTIARFEVSQENVDVNAKRLAKILNDNDTVIAVGGDGTASAATNGILLSEAKAVRLGVIGMGNFNDTSRCFNNLKFDDIAMAKTEEVWPLDCYVNGRHWRYANCYVTVGLLAESCEVFDEPKTRKTLRKGGKKTLFSLFALFRWWMKQHKKAVMPSFSLMDSSGDEIDKTGVSDYLAINSLTAAKIMKGGDYYAEKKDFLSSTGELNRFWSMVGFMLKAVFKKVPGESSEYDRLTFNVSSKVAIQAEGEYDTLENVKAIEVRKSKKPLLGLIKADKTK